MSNCPTCGQVLPQPEQAEELARLTTRWTSRTVDWLLQTIGAAGGPATASKLAEATGNNRRTVERWLAGANAPTPMVAAQLNTIALRWLAPPKLEELIRLLRSGGYVPAR